MKGIILAGGSGTRLHPLTISTSKQLLPVYDKPMIYYSMSALLLAGIKDILIISTPDDLNSYKKLFDELDYINLNIKYKIQKEPNGLAEAFIIGQDFIGNDNVCLVLGDNIFYGNVFQKLLSDSVDIVTKKNKCVVFGSYVTDPERYGVASFDNKNNLLSIDEKPKNPKSNYAVVGLYFYPNCVVDKAKKITPSKRGELEITSINQLYINENKIKINILSRGFAWLDTGTNKTLNQASEFVKIVQERTGLMISCLEEIAIKMGFVSKSKVLNNIKTKKGEYYNYLRRIIQ